MDDPIIQNLIAWVERRDSIRAVLLASTRTIPGAPLDPFSDYDVILAVTDVRPYFEDRAWLGAFGPVLAVYRDPLREDGGFERFAYITQYENDRLKIDFTVIQAAWLHHVAALPALPDELDIGYQVLLDKDDLTSGLSPPTYSAFIPTPPAEALYLERIEVFLHEATYVAKNIWRRELLPAKYSLDHVMKLKFVGQMLEWRMSLETGWSVKTGALGKGLRKHTPPDLWRALEDTYVGASAAENWDALFNTIELYRRVAIEVGEQLGYTYPHEMHRRMIAYLEGVKALESNASSGITPH
jgi:aminoglycoside 6-adenylyltransferase